MTDNETNYDNYDEENREALGFDSCPACNREYDEIDYEYQICSYCKHNANKPKEGEYQCKYCNTLIEADAEIITNGFMNVFGYKYCSTECLQDHINSK